jgi:hypothetical protein
MANVMDNKGSNLRRSFCPSCGQAAKDEEVTENCRLLKTGGDNVLSVCIRAQQFSDFEQAMSRADELGLEDIDVDDPCMDCKHNIITRDPGTFVEMKHIGATTKNSLSIEIHRCRCGTEFEVAYNQ